MNDDEDIVDELNFAAQHEDASPKTIALLTEAALTIHRYRTWLRDAHGIPQLEARIRRAADSSTDPVVARDLREALAFLRPERGDAT
jgi:hypothetical protein